MITGLMKNKFTQTLATGAAALGVLAGVGLASSPAQAGIFSLQTFNGVTPVTNCTPTTPGCVTDSEDFIPPDLDEPIWSTFPTPAPIAEGCEHADQGQIRCVNGYDNPMITYDGDLNGYFLIEYFTSGTATQTNNFLWNGVSLFGPRNGATDCGTDSFAQVCASAIVAPVNGKLPFEFIAGTTPQTNIPNGTPYVDPPGAPHYFATLNGTWGTTTGTNMVYLGLSDRPGATGDDDASDYVIKITSVKAPEPGTVLGLLAVGGLGALMKRKKQG